MEIGIPKEIKPEEPRVAITAEGCGELVRGGHEVFIERDAGNGSGFTNEDYISRSANKANCLYTDFHVRKSTV